MRERKPVETTIYDGLSTTGKVLFVVFALALSGGCAVGLVAVWVRVWPIL